MPRFQIVYGERNTPKEQWDGVYSKYVFDDAEMRTKAVSEFGSPQEAASIVRELNENMKKMGAGIIYMMRKLPDPVDYLTREAARDDYKPFEVQGDVHHCAELIGQEISFFDKLDHAYENRRTTMKLGRYLRAFTPKTDNEISEICARNGVECGDRSLKFARTREEIKHVYVNGPRSCMSGDSFDFKDNIHPAEAYATEDFAVAYIERVDGTRVSARAVINMKTKKFYTIYGDRERLKLLLTDAGYEETRPYGGDWLHGCRLLKIDVGYYRYACPYLDGDAYVHDHDDQYMMIGDSGAYCTEYGYITQDFEEASEDEYDDYDDSW